MPRPAIILRVFLSSPGDLAEERTVLDGVVAELNRSRLHQLGIILEVVKWETHVTPSVSSDPQAVVNEQIGDDYDIFIGLLWTRFGTPTGRALSGTEEEFQRAYARWQQDRDAVRIMFYLKTAPVSPEAIDPEQLARVHAFKRELGEHGVLFGQFGNADELAYLLRVHLTEHVQSWSKARGTEKPVSGVLVRPEALAERAPGVAAAAAEDEGEEGFIDLAERVEAEGGKANDALEHIYGGLEALAQEAQGAATQIEQVTGDSRQKFGAFKRYVNRLADSMADFASQLRRDVPILKASMYAALDAYGRLIGLLPEFGLTEADAATLAQTQEQMAQLDTTIAPNIEAVESTRATIASLPRVTTRFNRARREMLDALDGYVAALRGVQDLVQEVTRRGATLVADHGGAADEAVGDGVRGEGLDQSRQRPAGGSRMLGSDGSLH